MNLFLTMALLTTAVASAQVKLSAKERENDRKAIAGYIDKLNKEFYADETNPANSDTTGGNLADGTADAPRDIYIEGAVSYPADKTFKIFVIKGEDCGMHCNCLYTAYLHANGIKHKLPDAFLPVDTIYKLNDGKYLITQKAISCGGNLTFYTRASLVSFRAGKIIYHRISYIAPMSRNDEEDGGLSFWQYDMGAGDNGGLQIKYDRMRNLLSYKYISDYNQLNEAFTYTGFYKYTKGKFVKVREIKNQYIRPE